MSNIFHVAGSPRGNTGDLNQSAARRGKLDTVTAAMLTGGASGGWVMARAFRSRAARDEGYSRAQRRCEIADESDRQSQAA
jgi:hypothetical protein